MAKRKKDVEKEEELSDTPKPCLVLAQAEIPHVVEIGRRYPLTKTEYILSNSNQADIQIPSEATPESLVKLYLQEGKWRFENLSVRNDVYVNRSLNDEGPLQDGDFLQIGQTVYEFLAGTGWQSSIFFAMHQAIRIDAHTKAFNKEHFGESIVRWMALSGRHEKPLALVMMDIDDFKKLNTVYGHLAADEVLKIFSHRVRSRLRKEDSFYRVGGEEFTVLLPETPKVKAMQLAEGLRLAIAQEPFLVKGQDIPVTMSIGVASYQKGMTSQELYEKADKRMRDAKKKGKNQVLG